MLYALCDHVKILSTNLQYLEGFAIIFSSKRKEVSYVRLIWKHKQIKKHGVCKTLTTSPRQAIYKDGVLRLLTPREHLRLMGFTDRDYNHMILSGIEAKQVSFLAGNSICIPVLEALYHSLEDLDLLL